MAVLAWLPGVNRLMLTRRKVPFRLGSKRMWLVASVPTTATWPVAGFTAMAMRMLPRCLW